MNHTFRISTLFNFKFVCLIAFLFWIVASCGMEAPTDEWPDADADSDVDGDIDGDVDSDIDADSDVDSDADADAEYPEPVPEFVGMCLDGTDQNDESFTDCEDLDCMVSPGCCLDLQRNWINGNFAGCESLTGCNWSTFPASGSTVELDFPWLRLSSASFSETGIYTERIAELRGSQTLSFVASIDTNDCADRECRQSIGFAFTDQETLSGGTGVNPALGIVLDGELSMVHFMVNGRIEESENLTFEELTTPRGYGLRIEGDGQVNFWQGLPVESIDDSPHTTIPMTDESSYTSRQFYIGSGRELRLVLFGRFWRSGSGSFGEVRLQRPICDIPDNFERPTDVPVLRSTSTSSFYGDPTVLRMPDHQGLLMVYEHNDELEVAVSEDGFEWSSRGSFAQTYPHTPYGQNGRSSPSVMYLGPDSVVPGYHVWYEATSDFAGFIEGDSPRSAIIHATSDDGSLWFEDAGPFALIGAEDHPWRHEVGQPSVLQMKDGSFVMLFVGYNPETSMYSVGRAVSNDLHSWNADLDPITFDPVEKLPFERDGMAHPTVVRRGDVLHMWYTGYNGSRTSIGYAVGTEVETNNWVWQKFGPVLSSVYSWEYERVLAPSVVNIPTSPEDALIDTGTSHVYMWYQAGNPGREVLGVAIREIPAFLDAPPSEK